MPAEPADQGSEFRPKRCGPKFESWPADIVNRKMLKNRLIMFGRTPLESMLAIIASVFDAHSALLFLPDSSEKTPAVVRLCAFFSLSDDINGEAKALPGQNLPGWVAHNQAPLLVNPENEKMRPGYYRDTAGRHIRTFMGCPVQGGGVLCIDSKKKDAFAESEQKLLHLFALFIPQLLEEGKNIPAASVVEEAEYFCSLSKLESLRAQGTSWSNLLRVTLTLLVEDGGFEHAFLVTLSEDAGSYVFEDEFPQTQLREQIGKRPLENGLLGRAFLEGKAFFVDPERPAPYSGGLWGESNGLPVFTSFICLPLLLDGGCCAVLCLANSCSRRFSNELCRFVRLVGDSLQTTLEKISLKYRLNSLRKKLRGGRI